jgi:hypothetical protein
VIVDVQGANPLSLSLYLSLVFSSFIKIILF